MADTNAIQRLEAEKQRRIEERLATGDLVRSAETAVITADPGFVAPEPWIEKVEGGPDILHDPMYIITGVPRAEDGALGSTSRSAPEPIPAIGRADRMPPAPPRTEEPEGPPPYCAPDQASTPVFVVISNGNDDGDPGQVEHGRFSVEGGVLTLTDRTGAYLGAKRLRESDTPMAVARALLKDSLDSTGEFNRQRIPYPKLGLA